MAKQNNFLSFTILFAAIAVSCSLVFLGMRFGVSNDNLKTQIAQGILDHIEEQAEAELIILLDDDAVLGDPDAPVAIVEFSDFQCPYCSRFYNDAYQDIKEKYVDTGKVKLVFRDLPLGFHFGAYPAALATECAGDQGDDKYYAMHDMIFENQDAIGGEDAEFIVSNLKGFAADLELDTDEFNKCFDENKHLDEIQNDAEAANEAGINGTPGFIIGDEVISGAQPFSVFEAAIEKALNK